MKEQLHTESISTSENYVTIDSRWLDQTRRTFRYTLKIPAPSDTFGDSYRKGGIGTCLDITDGHTRKQVSITNHFGATSLSLSRGFCLQIREALGTM